MWRLCHQSFSKTVLAFSLISHLSLLGPNAPLLQCEHLSPRTRSQCISEVRFPQKPGFSILNERTVGNMGRGTWEKEKRNSE